MDRIARALHGVRNNLVSITDGESEYIFHLQGVGKKEMEPFRDMVLRQMEKVKMTAMNSPNILSSVQREVITKEIVMIPCQYCRDLMPQTSTFCPKCG